MLSAAGPGPGRAGPLFLGPTIWPRRAEGLSDPPLISWCPAGPVGSSQGLIGGTQPTHSPRSEKGQLVAVSSQPSPSALQPRQRRPTATLSSLPCLSALAAITALDRPSWDAQPCPVAAAVPAPCTLGPASLPGPEHPRAPPPLPRPHTAPISPWRPPLLPMTCPWPPPAGLPATQQGHV